MRLRGSIASATTPLDVGPPLFDHRRPAPARLRRLSRSPAWAPETERTRLGLLVGANPFRNPGIVAKMIDDARPRQRRPGDPRDRGAGSEPEFRAYGIDFGRGFGERLDWLEEAMAAVRAALDGEVVTSPPGGHYAFDDLRQAPVPVQAHLPIMIGGSGEKKTLRIVARDADLWNTSGPVEKMAHKVEILQGHCDAVGRDIAEIEFTLGVKLTIRDTAAEAVRVWKAAIVHNQTPQANVADDESSGRATRSRSPTGSGPTSRSASGRSSRSSRHPTTSRPSSGSSGRSCRSSTAKVRGAASYRPAFGLPSARRWRRPPTTSSPPSDRSACPDPAAGRCRR